GCPGMSRESRLVAVLLVISGIGVSGLMVVANQYRKTLAAQPAATPGARTRAIDATMNAVRLVDGFLAARERARSFLSSHPDAAAAPGEHADLVKAFRNDRKATLALHGMTFGDYAAVRAAWNDYRGGRAMSDAALAG